MPHARNCKPSIEAAGLTAASLAIGWLAWGGKTYLTPFAIIFPVIWAASKTRHTAVAVAIAYYLAATRLLAPPSLLSAGESNLLPGVLLWVVAVAINAGIWASLWSPPGRPNLFARLILAEIMLILPPFGIVGWTNPFMSAAALFPGLKWYAIAMGIVATWSIILLARNPSNKTISLFLVCSLASGWAQSQYKEPPDPRGWIAFPTHMGKGDDSPDSIRNRIGQIGEGVKVATGDGHFNVVVFPEHTLGNWDERIQPGMLRTELGHDLASGRNVVVVGARMRVADTKKTENVLVVLSRQQTQHFASRQPTPFSEWKPWSTDGVVSGWWKTGIHEVAGMKASFLFGYENLLAWPILSDFLLHNPHFIVSVENAWWVHGINAEDALPAQHAKVWGKIFGVPVLRAVNAS